MKYAVRYYTRGGNTRKLAATVAELLSVPAEDVSTPLEETADVVFLGASLYAGKPHAGVVGFLEKNADKIGKIVLFGSSASLNSTYKKVAVAAEKLGVRLHGEEFVCPGHFLFMHKGRPNEQDLEDLKSFVIGVKETIENE